MAQTHISQPILFPSFSFFFARLSLPIDTEPKQLLRCLRTTIAVVLFLSEATQLQPSFGLLGEHKRLHGSAALCGRTYCTCQRPALRRGDIGFRGCNIKLKTIISGCAANAVVVADDKSYGNKQIISVTPRLYDYILDNVREPEVLRQLREETAFMRGSMMQVSPDQAQLLAMLVQIHGAEKCIEVGVYTGYSSLAIALVLPESGKLVACDRDPRCLEVAKKYYEKSNVSHKVDIRYGLAADTLRSLILNGEACSYDFAFVDADKRMYPEYLELLLQLVRVGGLIVFDNVLWHGRVADPEVNDAKTVSIRNFNADLMEDERVSISMVPIGDGMTICRKR